MVTRLILEIFGVKKEFNHPGKKKSNTKKVVKYREIKETKMVHCKA